MKDGGPAFPLTDWRVSLRDAKTFHGGMTLRDYFASAALSCIEAKYGEGEQIARFAYKIADSMLAERDKSTTK